MSDLTEIEADIRRMIKALLKVRDATVDQLAIGTGLSAESWGQRLRGRTHLSAVDLRLAADFLGVSPAVLYSSPDSVFAEVRRPTTLGDRAVPG